MHFLEFYIKRFLFDGTLVQIVGNVTIMMFFIGVIYYSVLSSTSATFSKKVGISIGLGFEPLTRKNRAGLIGRWLVMCHMIVELCIWGGHW